MSAHTFASIEKEFRPRYGNQWRHEDVNPIIAALADARNELARCEGTLNKLITDLSPAEKERDALTAELAKLRPVVEAARECATRRLDTGLMSALHLLAQAIYAADADGTVEP